ncbi:MAG TPA: ABC transporter substrate-binding protein [Chloroflexota bacterium]|nr:ABC transporter substrate-binding protein [Chloroflexota bacterium]
MATLALSLAVTFNERTRPIIEGQVRPEGIELAITVCEPGELFWRQLKAAEFDVSEMSLASLLQLVARGDTRWWGLPIFTMRQFFHTGILVRADAGIARPQDLRGRRVGVPEYQQTAALWVRGVLQHEFGVAPTEMVWYMERAPEQSHAAGTGFQPPPGLELHYIPPERSIAEMLLAGDLDAAAFYIPQRTLLDRSGVDLRGHPRVRPLFPDAAAEGARYYRQTGLFPINHGMVVRRTLVAQHPWVPLNLYQAFERARERFEAQGRAFAAPYVQTGIVPATAAGALDQTLYPYGVAANRRVLETIAQYAHEQGLTPRVVALDELFAPSTLAT